MTDARDKQFVITESPERIWLEPQCNEDAYEGRSWCQNKLDDCEECQSPAVEYVRADLAKAADACALAQAEGVAKEVLYRARFVPEPAFLQNVALLLTTQAAELARLREALADVLNGLDSEFGPWRTDVNFPKLRALLAQHQPQEAGS